MEKLKLYSIKNNFLSEKFTNWDALFFETKQTLRTYLTNASEWHKFNYLIEKEPFEFLPSDCYNELLMEIICLWYPFYYNLYRGVQEEIESNVNAILCEFKL
jgi:hypothetical protein